jgi:hypothetical protein
MSTKNKSIKGLEISEKDFPELMTYEDAVSACQKLGDGWRLPTIRELMDIIGEGTEILGDYKRETYLSSTYSSFSGQLWHCGHSEIATEIEDLVGLDSDYVTGRVRAVRSIGKKDNSYLKEVAAIIKEKMDDQKDSNIVAESEGIEISHANLIGEYTWYEATEICKLVGDGWHLPVDPDALEFICQNMDLYGHYWTEETSILYGEKEDDKAMSVDIDGGVSDSSLCSKNNTAQIIFVKDLAEE